MARRVVRTDRVIALLGGAVVLLGVAILWLVGRDGLPFGGEAESPEARAQAQLAEHAGQGARVVYTERGKRNAVCGYVRIGGADQAFVSRPNRIALQSDPLRKEFEEMQADLCPGFLRAPAAGRRGA